MTKRELEKQIFGEFEQRRKNAVAESLNATAKLLENENFAKVYEASIRAHLEFLKNKNDKTKTIDEQAKAELEKFAKANKIDLDACKVKYACAICKDEGIVNGQFCKCFFDELKKRQTELQLDLQDDVKFCKNDENFAKNNENLQKIYQIAKNYANKFPEVKFCNLNFVGKTGTGKTHLLKCVAHELVEKNFDVLFLSAFAINDECRKYNYGLDNNLQEILTCQILVIDDLGSEPILKNVTQEYFFNIFDQRQKQNLATLMSSNLNLDDLQERYEERTFSRICNKRYALTLEFDGDDKRIKID